MHTDTHYYPSASRRMVTFGKRGMVATSQSLAAQVGVEILRKGGNAIDAAIATAAALTVLAVMLCTGMGERRTAWSQC